MRTCLLIFLVVLFAVSCAPRAETEAQEPDQAGKTAEPEKKSVAREAVEGFTGKTAVDTLKRARPKIEAAGEAEKQKQQDIDELTKP